MDNLDVQIDRGQEMVQDYHKLAIIITLMLNQSAIQFFKDEKLVLYYKAMNLYSNWEV